MPEETVITDKKEEKPLGVEIREKSFQQLLQEQAAARKPAEEKPIDIDPKKEEEEKAAKEAEEAKARIEAEEEAKKRDAEIARQAADEVVKKQQLAEQEKADKLKAEEAEAERQKRLQPKWKTDPNAPKDENGNPLPSSYDEIALEAKRIAKEEAKAEIMAEIEAREKAKQAEIETIRQSEEQKKAAQKEYEDQLQKEIDEDLKDLYMNNKLPKIKNKDDEHDAGNMAFRQLFETAQKVNADRIQKGQAPIRSLKLIYYEHYKPPTPPAGHDAPVLGSESPITKSAPEDKYVPSRDRGKSMKQLIKEEKDRMLKKLNIRGM